MTTWLVLGATGSVGQELTAALTRDPGNDVWAISRNRVLLQALGQRTGCRWLRMDVSQPGRTPEDLPVADVVLDLTYPIGRHPRALLGQAERTIALLNGYLRVHPAARLVHAATFAVPSVTPAASPNTSPKSPLRSRMNVDSPRPIRSRLR